MTDTQHTIAQAERRVHQRYSVEVPIQLQPEDDSSLILCRTSNLGLYGCSLLLQDQLPLGLRLQIELSLSQQTAMARERVISRHPQFGNGIMFVKFEGDGEQYLRRFLKGLQE